MVDDKRQAMTIRLDESRYEWLRRQAYERRIPMQKILEEAIDLRAAPTAEPNWRTVAEALAKRMYHHAHCDRHPKSTPDSECPFCEDRTAYDLYQRKADTMGQDQG